jgi:hypothetical protein
VANYAGLATLDVAVGSSVKVKANSQNKWEIYLKTVTGWQRVGLQDGTIAFDESLWNYSIAHFGFDAEVFDAQYYDQEPIIETRNVIQAINYELFIDDLAIYRNQLLTLMFQYILTEEQSPEWLMKTSFIDVRHDIRALLPFPIYRQDNQNFVLDYLQEVKPYHVQVKDFNLVYSGQDDYPGVVTDFDCPAYYDNNLVIPQYVSPILLPYTASTATGTGTPSDIADTASAAEIWATTPWNEWYNHYLLSLQSIMISSGGSGYVTTPTVIVGTEWTPDTTYTIGQQIFYGANLYSVTVAGTSGTTPPEFTTGSQSGAANPATNPLILTYAGVAATAVAVINSRLQVAAVNIINEGSGYTTTPTIIFTNETGTGAQAYAVMGNDLVRNFNMTIKYDRYEYHSNITDWNYLVESYPAGSQVRYVDRVWQANVNVSNMPTVIAATGTAGSYELTLASNPSLITGTILTGIGIPENTTITEAIIGSNVITLSQALLVSINSELVTFYDAFIFENWVEVPASTLSGIDRTQGYYAPTVNQPGRSLPLLIDGLEYPGVQVYGLGFTYNPGYDVGNYDINSFDNISYGPEGLPTYEPALLDAAYSSSYVDPFLGTRPTDINVDGGAYIDTFSSYAPEELVPGSEFDTLDFRVYTTPGADYNGTGHGFPANSNRYVYNSADPVLSFAGLLDNPFTVVVFNVTLGLAIEAVSYDWVNYTVTVGLTETDGDILDIYVTGVGGGNQLYLNTYNEESLSSITVPFALPSDFDMATTYSYGDVVIYNSLFYQAISGGEFGDGFSGRLPNNTAYWTPISKASVIYEFLIYNGENRLIEGIDYTYASNGDRKTTVYFTTTYNITNRINLLVLGYADVGPTHSWSLPLFETIISDGSTTYTVNFNLPGTNQVNTVVTVNGVRLQPYSGGEYHGDGSTVTFALPNNNVYDPATVTANDIFVYVDNVKLVNEFDYIINPYDGSSASSTITFNKAPIDGATILLSVATGAGYRVYGNSITFLPGSVPNPGDIVEPITWGDTTEQGLLTKVFVGLSANNNTTYDIGRAVTNPERLLVTLDGYWLFSGINYVINGTTIIISGVTIDPSSVLAITLFTNNVVPAPLAFRIFQDMRGVQATYRITPSTTTSLVQSVTPTDDIIYVKDASALGEPNFATAYNNNSVYNIGDVVMYDGLFYQAIAETIGHPPTDPTYWETTAGAPNSWGVITIDGERILYRHRDTEANTVSGLLRGTAGTAITSHTSGTAVYDMGRGNLLPETCQNYIESNITYPLVSGVNLADGTTTLFTAKIDISQEDSTIRDETVEIYIGGERVQSGYTITADNPLTVVFDTPPPAGVEVTILVRRAHAWYNLATPELPLSETNTLCARFLQGQ